jgi:hypothetical protein
LRIGSFENHSFLESAILIFSFLLQISQKIFILNFNLAGYIGSKNEVETRQNIKFIQLDFSKVKCR